MREISRGGWSTGHAGQSPERLKAHMRNQHKFDILTLRAPKDDPEVGGDYYCLPWPCWGKPEIRHPGAAILYDTSLHVLDVCSPFQALFDLERDVPPLRELGSDPSGASRTGEHFDPTMDGF